jgi:hypothetical protein
MRIGLLTRRDNSGLGYQTKALYELLKPTRVLCIDSTPFNGHSQNLNWYKDADYLQITNGFPTDHDIDLFLRELDILITCEIPYNYTLFSLAKERGIKTVLQPNAEFNQHFYGKTLPKPDAFFLPSKWYEQETKELGIPTYYCPPPTFKEQKRNITKEQGKLRVLHIGGKKAFLDRNGTDDVSKINLPDVEITISQQVMSEEDNNMDLYKGDYDIVLIPRKYGGLCLPMRESLAFGYPVIMPHIPPNNDLLPKEWLSSPSRRTQRMMKRLINVYENDIQSIVKRLEYFRDMTNEEYLKQVEKAYTINRQIESDIKWEEYLKEIVDE